MIIEFLKEDESRVRWSYDDGKTWHYADIDELIEAYENSEVVCCKDCKWWNGNDCKARDIDVVDVDDYCSYGERKEQEDV